MNAPGPNSETAKNLGREINSSVFWAARRPGMNADSGKRGRAGLDALLAARGVEPVTFRDWQQIDAAEIANARAGAPREKFTDVTAMLGVID